jgi:hypothetical protein
MATVWNVVDCDRKINKVFTKKATAELWISKLVKKHEYGLGLIKRAQSGTLSFIIDQWLYEYEDGKIYYQRRWGDLW